MNVIFSGISLTRKEPQKVKVLGSILVNPFGNSEIVIPTHL
jgi:hypothetical protein